MLHFQNHPAVQKHLGLMLVSVIDRVVLAISYGVCSQPDWRTFQKTSGDVVFVNMGMFMTAI